MARKQLRQFDPVAERAKIRACISARQLGGLANNTKWMELIEACYAMNWQGPFYSCKCIDSDNISEIAADWYHLPYPSSAIEWLDIFYWEKFSSAALLPVQTIDHSDEIESALKRIGFDYKKGKVCFRIFGYTPRNENDFDPIQSTDL